MRLASAFLLSICAACAQSIASAWIALGAGLLILAAARPSLSFALPRLAAVNGFIALMFLIVPLTAPGPHLFAWGWLAISAAGLRLCCLIALKANAIAAIFIALVAPMGIADLGRALSALGCPDRLAWLFLLMDRNVHLLKREWRKLWDSARLRAFAPRSSLYCYRVYAAMLGLLLIRAHDRGRACQEAMLLAGYDGSLPFKGHIRFGAAEAACSAMAILLSALIYSPAIHALA